MAPEECHEYKVFGKHLLVKYFGSKEPRRVAAVQPRADDATRLCGGGWGRTTLLRFLRLDVHVDRDFVAEQVSAVIEGLVPVDAVVLAVDGRLQREAGALVAPRVLGEAEKSPEGDALGHAVHRQIAGDVERVLRLGRCDLGALEGDVGILLASKIGAAEMLVAIGFAVSMLTVLIVNSTDESTAWRGRRLILPLKSSNLPPTLVTM